MGDCVFVRCDGCGGARLGRQYQHEHVDKYVDQHIVGPLEFELVLQFEFQLLQR